MATRRSKKGTGSEPVYKEIGARITWLREQRRWSVRELADALGTHTSTLNCWEKALAKPGVAELNRIAHACGADLSVFLADLPVELCLPSADKLARRKEVALKRVAVMRKNGTFGKRKGKAGNAE